jgi:hypothetical protein
MHMTYMSFCSPQLLQPRSRQIISPKIKKSVGRMAPRVRNSKRVRASTQSNVQPIYGTWYCLNNLFTEFAMSSGVHLLYMHTWILDANLMELCAHYSINCKYILYYYFQIYDQMDGVSVTKLFSNLWPRDVIFVTKVMANQWPYYIKPWQCQIPFYDDLNMTSMTIPRWWSQQPRHWWRHRLVICQRGIRQAMTNTRLHLWRNRIVTLL